MKRYRVIISPNTLERIEDSFEFIFKQSPQNGINWLQELYDAIDSLEKMPSRCGTIREQDSFGIEIRQLLHYSHRIIFTIDDSTDSVRVLEFRHAAQDDWKG